MLDHATCTYHMEALIDTPPVCISAVIRQVLTPLGFELADEDECAPVVDEMGWLRIPALPVAVPAAYADDRGSVNIGLVGRVLTAAAVLTSISYIPNIVEVLTS